jgi:hypothetical protein
MLHLQLSERDVERLLAGDQPQGRTDLAEVARVMARLRALGDMEYPPPMQPRLLAELDAAEARPPHIAGEVHPRAEARRQAHDARRRWRLVGAAAMIAMLGGIVVAQARDDAPSGSPSDSTERPHAEQTPTTKAPDATTAPTTAPTTVPPQTTAPPPPPTHANDQPSSSGSDPQVDAPGPPAVTSDDRPSNDPAWETCGSDPACWWNLWNQYAKGSRP